jgi:hypothetical protein
VRVTASIAARKHQRRKSILLDKRFPSIGTAVWATNTLPVRTRSVKPFELRFSVSLLNLASKILEIT